MKFFLVSLLIVSYFLFCSRSFDGSGENLIHRRSVREASPLSKESPKIEHFEATRRKLSSGIRASSLECTLKDGLLSPPPKSPKRGNSPDSTRATHSLEQLHSNNDVTLEVPRVASLVGGRLSSAASPCSSEPTIPLDEGPRVNFYKSLNAASDSLEAEDSKRLPMSMLEEIQPMLEDPSEADSNGGSSSKRHSANVRNWLSGLLKPKTSSKFPMNGLHHDNVV